MHVVQVREMERQLQGARTWVSEAQACMRHRPAFSRLEHLLAWNPPPVHMTGLQRLRDALTAGQEWLAKYREAGADEKAPVEKEVGCKSITNTKYLSDDGTPIEPMHYAPVILMVLVNGQVGFVTPL